MRHGQAESYSNSGYDKDRNLTDAGIDQVTRAAECLSKLNVRVDDLWVSPYVRAQQTAEHVNRVLSIETVSTRDFIVPESNPNDFLSSIDIDGDSCLAIVSHQPYVSSLISLLIQGNLYSGPAMGTASLCYLESEINSVGCFSLKWLRHAPDFNVE